MKPLPKLIAISSGLRGKVVELREGATLLGRDPSNDICVPLGSASRKHCEISVREDECIVRDLESLNGTFVNGVPVHERLLAHGDQVEIGEAAFLFSLEPEPGAVPEEPEPDGTEIRATVELRLGEGEHLLHPHAGFPGGTARAEAHLRSLYQLSTALHGTRSLESLQEDLLKAVLQVVPLESGAVRLCGTDSEEFVSIFGWSSIRGCDPSVAVSNSISARVLRERVAILSNDACGTAGPTSASLMEAQVRRLLCTPIMAFGRAIGVLYLTGSEGPPLDHGHLELAAAMGAIAGLAIRNLQHLAWLQDENQKLRSGAGLEHSLIGESGPMREVYGFIAKVAPTGSTVLLLGESGTGKELAARALHQNSDRADRPFVAINCATLTETLLESELFGHEKGAFTGAVALKKGKLEAAEGGTLLLDEVAELAPLLQAKLLRVLQEREFERVGGTRPIKADLRIIAATNRDLEQAVHANQFRRDLFFRLNVVSLRLPPLRDRKEDIPLLASLFVSRYAGRCKRRVRGISPEARAFLMAYDWPGNVRELENAVERAVALGGSDVVLPEDLPESVLERPATSESTPAGRYYDVLNQVKRDLIVAAVRQSGGNYTEAATQLGVHPNYLHRLVRNLELKSTLVKEVETLKAARGKPAG